MAKKRKRQGHFCWCCAKMRPHERFSGAGHARHLCKDCSRLGKSELQYRQDTRNLERLVTWEGIIGRKKRKAFHRFLEHPDPRIRRYAEELAAEDVKARSYLRLLEDEDHFEPAKDDCEGDIDAAAELNPGGLGCQNETLNEFDDEDIPF
jgi:hypothetical protein